ncbi:ribonuclease R [Sphingomonas melonis TY]|uniref:Ribonuclease R n=2 Tax=Pseudomonadati TaxID=3379134 RepID=A0A175Y1Y0_9SPHN|nr:MULTISPECIES: ribonuclease R [Sphingomonas]MBI0529964.1 ribonuclease R [Sphingomonas sp. TX0522]ATI56462.1 ribonuclease R [Sphingomonas melonis]KZB94445.1 ribonuclease R [Sphingomonas melonis TY]MCM2298558.1 ribonuclease R [Sphingomonas sp.]MCP4027199.1 ribonuclease R [Sphingomonas sp.]
MAKKPRPGLPTQAQILDFITQSEVPAGKREIAKAFGLTAQEKIALKAMLKDMADEGLIDSAPGRAFHKMGGLPKVTVLRIADVDDGGNVWAVPDRWEADGPVPRLRVRERKRGALGIGERILARTEEAGNGWIAHPMKVLARASEQILGVLRQEGERFWLTGVEKKERREFPVSDTGGAAAGDLVMAEMGGRPPRITVRVVQRLGDPFAPRSFSLIAIHKLGIPDVFTGDTLDEAKRVSALSLGEDREDLTHLPIVAIDPVDARDHDDAVWAAPHEDGGWQAVVAIADVSFYVRPGSELDREARRRGNSVYFPDRVVPMLPEILSAEVCSLKEGEDRAALVCHLHISKSGKLESWRFARARVRTAANLAYEEAQATIDADAGAMIDVLRPLWACWRALAKARDAREPLDLDLPERRVVLDEQGRIMSVAPRERLDAHRLIEDYMIAANVAAAKALEAKKAPVMYRVHEPPSREKLVALKDYLETFDVPFALGQVIRPATFNHILDRIGDADFRPQVMEQVLRTQTQAYYAPANQGHFGLSLGSYAHFTSPIRRYADLVVHRALVAAYGLGEGGLTKADAEAMEQIGTTISALERRAMEAERDTIDRYVAAFLAERVGETVSARITGVQNYGFFATVEGIGGDGLMSVRDLGGEYFRFDEAARTLTGEDSGEEYALGQRLELRLAEANPVSGALRFELPGGKGAAPGPRHLGKGIKGGRKDRVVARRGRPGNIRHNGKRR